MDGKLDGERERPCCADAVAEPTDCQDEERSGSHPDDLFEGSSELCDGEFRPVPWNLRDVAIAAAVFAPVGVGGSLGLGFVLVRLGLVEDRTLAIVLGSVALPAALIAAAWVFGLLRHGASASHLGFRSASAVDMSWMPALALATGLTTTGLYALLVNALGIDILAPEQNLEELAAIDGLARAPVFAIVGVLAPFAEEVFFRGFLLAALIPAVGRLRGAVVGSAIFSAAHLNVGTLFPIFVMGMLLSWLYLRTGSIWPPFAAHAAQNLLALTVLELPFDAPAFLSV